VENSPEKWIVHCDKVGRGKEALQYPSRYLYRGVISDKNILKDDGDRITFRYRDSKTGSRRGLASDVHIATGKCAWWV